MVSSSQEQLTYLQEVSAIRQHTFIMIIMAQNSAEPHPIQLAWQQHTAMLVCCVGQHSQHASSALYLSAEQVSICGKRRVRWT